MSEFALVPSQMAGAGAAASGAAADARGASGTDALATLASALPGTTTAEIAPDLGEAWETGIDGWAGRVDSFAAAIEATSKDGTTTDGAAGGLFGALFGGP